jgi:hypothetical protein
MIDISSTKTVKEINEIPKSKTMNSLLGFEGCVCKLAVSD